MHGYNKELNKKEKESIQTAYSREKLLGIFASSAMDKKIFKSTPVVPA